MKKLLALGAIALMLSGCSAGPKSMEASGSAATYPSTYRSVEELRDAFVRAGGSCDHWEQDNVVKAAAESGRCSESNVLSIYTSKAEVDRAVQLFKSLGSIDAKLLVGENWIINDPAVGDLPEEFGGTFVTTSE